MSEKFQNFSTAVSGRSRREMTGMSQVEVASRAEWGLRCRTGARTSAGRGQNMFGTRYYCAAVLPGPPSAKESCAMCGVFHNRTGIRMLKSVSPAHDQAFEATDQPAEQGLNEMDNAVNLAQVKAELSYLNRLDQRRETNVASLKRLKEARDALLGRGSEVAGGSISRRF